MRLALPGARRRAASILLLALATACARSPAPAPAGAASAGAVASDAPRPNIVVILADDLGYSDLGSYGGEIRTPNLDRLARGGLRFTDFYNMARCVPTRAALLTGVYPHQAGLGGMTFDQGLPGYRGALGENTVTIAEALRGAGYRTGMVGKWHVSRTLDRRDREEQLAWLAHQASFGDFSPRDQYPTARGFDDYFGNLWGVVDYFDPFALVDGTEPVREVPPGYYHTDAISDTAVAYVERYARDDRPFFLYVAHTAPHWPLQAPAEDVARYADTYDTGWDAIREARHRRLVAEGILDSASGRLPPRVQRERTWEANPRARWDARAMAVHAAMVERMDRGVGRIVAALERTRRLDDTVILFLSDNGASPEDPSRFGPGFDRAGATRDGRSVVFPVEKDSLPGAQTVHAGIGPIWANVANTPFRGAKARPYEGGIATPLIAHWPAGLRGSAGTVTRQPGHVVDLMATALELAGAAYPTTRAGRAVVPLAGRSLVPVLRGGTRAPHDALYWEHEGSQAIREGDWKLVAPARGAEWELYHLARDRTELTNLAARDTARVRAMSERWAAWAERSAVLPRPARP